MKWALRYGYALLTWVLARLGDPATARPVGWADTFESDAVGSLRAAWSDIAVDVAVIDPASPAPNPSAVVAKTTDAFRSWMTASVPVAAIAPTHGIYCVISLIAAAIGRGRVRRLGEHGGRRCTHSRVAPPQIGSTAYTVQGSVAC
jgi:hypothetical protein